MAKHSWAVGQAVVMVYQPAYRRGAATITRETIKSIGRRYGTLGDSTHTPTQFQLEDGYLKADTFSGNHPGRVYASAEEYISACRLGVRWSQLQKAMNWYRSLPEHMTVEIIENVANLLGIILPPEEPIDVSVYADDNETLLCSGSVERIYDVSFYLDH